MQLTLGIGKRMRSYKMKNTYEIKQIETLDGLIEVLEMTSTGGTTSTVPMAEGNRDYQEYLAQLENEGI